MQFEDVEAFLTVVECGSIVKAAEKLYISQGTCSTRIMNLENELNIRLLFRQQGVRKITLTPQGEYFLVIAKEWIALQREALNIKHIDIYQELRIASTDVISTFLLNEVYAYFVKTQQNISLYLQTEHSTEAHQLIEQQEIDIAFVATLHTFSNVLSLPLFSEEMVILCHDDNPFLKTKNLNDLDTNYEIYSKWSSEYELWHNRIFPNAKKRITIGTMSMAKEFILYPHTWTIATKNIADFLCLTNNHLAYVEFNKDKPPIRTTYMLYYRYQKPWMSDIIKIFMKETYNVIKSHPGINLFFDPDNLFYSNNKK